MIDPNRVSAQFNTWNYFGCDSEFSRLDGLAEEVQQQTPSSLAPHWQHSNPRACRVAVVQSMKWSSGLQQTGWWSLA